MAREVKQLERVSIRYSRNGVICIDRSATSRVALAMSQSVQALRLYKHWHASGITLEVLRAASGLKISTVSLSRKLRGVQPMTLDEAAAISRALGLSISIESRRAA